MALEALSANEFLNFIIYDTISATPFTTTPHDSSDTTTGAATPPPVLFEPNVEPSNVLINSSDADGLVLQHDHSCQQQPQQRRGAAVGGGKSGTGQRKAAAVAGGLGAVQGRKKRRRRPRVCKNKEEAETQRMTHIAVERNRRKQMNEHLAVLRSLMPDSYVQRGDQASIVGGAIEFVKELEHLLQSLEAQKHHFLQQQQESNSNGRPNNCDNNNDQENEDLHQDTKSSKMNADLQPPFSQFFSYPQYTWSQAPSDTSAAKAAPAAVADIEVTLIETHANLRILSRRNPRLLSRLVAGFHTLHLSILHLNVTTMHSLVLYSISAKVEEGCQLTSVDDIAGAVHHMLRIIEDGSEFC